ncbi:MAG: fused MFS/spermidine synthase [Nitrospirota bacterium]
MKKERLRPSPSREENAPKNAAPSRPFLYYLATTAIVCGALVMVIEILGSRVIGPFFGASLFVWTSLITVTLVALAAGYAAGGVLADRKPSPAYLYGIILCSGVFTLLVPVLKGPVLKATVSWGLRTGAFASSLALFGPALFLLGCVSPYLVRIAAREMRNIGRTVGVFYAISTVGSFVGTVLTGFVLIAYFGVNAIFTVVGTLLIALAAGYFLFFRRNGFILPALILPLFLYLPEGPVSKVMANGTRVSKVFSKDTHYGNLKVVDYSLGEKRHRELMIDGLIQGGIDVNDRQSVYEYAYYLEFLPYGINPAGKNCLVIGLGAGLVPAWYEARGIRTDIVDIDPDVVAIAKNYFGFHVSGDVIIADARYYLNTSSKQYDYIILDVFNGDTTPGHILSLEALELVKARLTEKGILAINLIGSLKHENFMTASIIRTLEKVFRKVDIYPNYAVETSEGGGNITVLAYNAAFKPFDRRSVAGLSIHPFARNGVDRHLGTTYRLPAGTPGVVLTDDHNPIDFYDVWLKEWVRNTILSGIDFDILI